MEPQWITYRAWHHDKKVMMHVSEIDFRKQRIKGRAKDEVISARFDEVTLMPWTTYYDNSRDYVMIYEGDVIEVTRKDMKKRFVIDDEMGVLLARCIADEQYPFVTFDLEMLICDDIDHEQLMSIIKRKSKRIVAVLSVLALLFIAVPTQDTVNKMIIANALTTNNIKGSASFTQDQIGQIIDKIADAAIKVKQAENGDKT